MGTELLIDNIIEAFPKEEELGVKWERDCVHNPMVKENLSYSKMMHEVNKLEPRKVLPNNVRAPYGLCMNAGRHSSKYESRKSEFNDLGVGINLYFKMLKYLQCLFLVMLLISLPSLTFYCSGSMFDTEKMAIPRWLGYLSLGNINTYKTITCSNSGQIPPVKNKLTYMAFKCPKGYQLVGLQQFGLSFQDNTCTGLGINMKIETIERCSIGTSKN